MHDLEYHSAHAQMEQSQGFRKLEISFDTGHHWKCRTFSAFYLRCEVPG